MRSPPIGQVYTWGKYQQTQVHYVTCAFDEVLRLTLRVTSTFTYLPLVVSRYILKVFPLTLDHVPLPFSVLSTLLLTLQFSAPSSPSPLNPWAALPLHLTQAHITLPRPHHHATSFFQFPLSLLACSIFVYINSLTWPRQTEAIEAHFPHCKLCTRVGLGVGQISALPTRPTLQDGERMPMLHYASAFYIFRAAPHPRRPCDRCRTCRYVP